MILHYTVRLWNSAYLTYRLCSTVYVSPVYVWVTENGVASQFNDDGGERPRLKTMCKRASVAHDCMCDRRQIPVFFC